MSSTYAHNGARCLSYKNEQNIHWVVPDLPPLLYLREKVCCFPFRQKMSETRLGHTVENLVAYAILQPDAPSVWPGQFYRRYWYYRDHDITHPHKPYEAVLVESIHAGAPSIPVHQVRQFPIRRLRELKKYSDRFCPTVA